MSMIAEGFFIEGFPYVFIFACISQGHFALFEGWHVFLGSYF